MHLNCVVDLREKLFATLNIMRRKETEAGSEEWMEAMLSLENITRAITRYPGA